MHYNLCFFKIALPDAVFKIFNKDNSLETFFEENILNSITMDSRLVKLNDIFLAYKGESLDGHDFLFEALKNGAAVIIIENKKEFLLEKFSAILQNKLVIIVEDSLKALVQLAKNWRQKFNYPIVGITGSVGKTTTKQMLANILKAANINSYISYKNQNNLIGLSLNVLKLSCEYQMAVFELGIAKVGQMEHLVDILRPTIGVITRVAHSHAQGLGSLVQIANEKKKIFKYFGHNDFGVVFGDQPLISGAFYKNPIIRFGLKTKNQVQARKIKFLDNNLDNNFIPNVSFVFKIYTKQQLIQLKGHHTGLIFNALAAGAVANLLSVSFEKIIEGLESFESFDDRFQIKKFKNKDGFIISDCYNANPESMKAAILAFSQMKISGPKIALLGDMLELGEKELFWHRQIGRYLRKFKNFDNLILVGERSKQIAKTVSSKFNVTHVQDWIEAKDILTKFLNNSSNPALVLVKASRGMQLDNIVKEFAS